jgi:hypothetical protein
MIRMKVPRNSDKGSLKRCRRRGHVSPAFDDLALTKASLVLLRLIIGPDSLYTDVWPLDSFELERLCST